MAKEISDIKEDEVKFLSNIRAWKEMFHQLVRSQIEKQKNDKNIKK